MNGSISRSLKISLPPRQSAFLWGPRKTGKSTLLRELFPHSRFFDFLDTGLFLEMSRMPSLLRQQVLALKAHEMDHPVILDEVQKVPGVLDEVHWLIENKGVRFVLCGSSARKLRRGHANLLGGRAWRFELFPFVSPELPEFDLLRALRNGLVPSHYLQEDASRSLRAYVQDYLKEEVFDEGLVRNIPAFSRFFDALTFSQGELVNYSNIARDCGVDSKTVREYYQILSDTLLGRFVEPFRRQRDRGVILRAPKFYLFDVGVSGFVARRQVTELRGEAFGRAFEHFLFMEITAYRSYREKDFDIRFWRTKSGHEVDFVLGDGQVAVEVKGTSRVDNRDLRGLEAFMGAYHPESAILVCCERAPRQVKGISVMPWQEFLSALWGGKVI